MHPFPLLPELMDLVFQNLEEKKGLSLCRLVSRAFCAAATRSFYRTFSITLHYPGPAYTISRCKAMNELLDSKPYILDYIRVLRIYLTSEWQEGEEEFREDGLDGVNSSEITKLLLKMTHAVGLEELSIDAGGWDNWYNARDAGKDNMLALLAIRCMPSLRRMHLEYLDNPPIALLIGIPGKDSMLEMSIESGSLGIESMEADWNALCIPEGPLVHTFKEAKADWETILHVTSHLHTFNSAETPPLHQLAVLNVKKLDQFHTFMFYVQEKMGGRQPLFPQLRTFHCHPSISDNLSAGQTPEWVGRMLSIDYTSVRKVVITIQPSLTEEDFDKSIVPLSFLLQLQEIEFLLVKDSHVQRDKTIWIEEAIRWLQTLSAQQNIEHVAIAWRLTFPSTLTLWQSTGWNELQDCMDTVRALSRAKMVMDVVVDVRGVPGVRGTRMAAEQLAFGLRQVWTHPRCISNASRAEW